MPDQGEATRRRIDEATAVLAALGLPPRQCGERSALTLLALLGLKPEIPWSRATAPLCGITPMMDYFSRHYGKTYAPNTRETVRRQSVHQFLQAGIVLQNPDDPLRPTNSGRTVYQIGPSVLRLLRTYGTKKWEGALRKHLKVAQTLTERYASKRQRRQIPLKVSAGVDLHLSPGKHSQLIRDILTKFLPQFTPGATILYVGDTGAKMAYVDTDMFAKLGITVEEHGKLPDMVAYDPGKRWLLLIEAVTSHGPVDPKRHVELRDLFKGVTTDLVFVTAFPDRRTLRRYIGDISWETEVWLSENPTHLIHFDGERFLGPYQSTNQDAPASGSAPAP